MVQEWVDFSAGLAYIAVAGRLTVFREFLDAIERLLSHPDWRPGMPVVEDLRGCEWVPPPAAIDEWKNYVDDRQPQLQGSRWAVVTRGDNVEVGFNLDAAAEDAAPSGVTLKQFTNMIEAHLWAQPPEEGLQQ